MKTTPENRIEALTTAGLWGGQTLHGLLAEHVSSRPHDLAVKDQPNRQALTGHDPLGLTWLALDNASHSLAYQLSASGVAEGDTILVQLPNIAELVVLYYAVAKMGVVVSPVPVQYGAHELRMLAGALQAKSMISIERLREAPLAAAAREALPELAVLEFGRDLQLETSSGEPFAGPAADPDRTLSICWTSGTTGTPKGVPRSHNMWLATGRTSIAAGSMQPDDVLLNPFPLVNMAALGGFLFPAAILGAAIVLHHPLDPGLYLSQLQDERITFTIAPPPLLNQLAKAPAMWSQFDFTSLRRIGSGSAPLAPSMIATFEQDYGKQIVNFYGSNEGISLFSTPEDAVDPQVRASMFRRPDQGALIETRVVDPDTGEELTAEGARGELLISGATVFDGYFHHDNRDVFDPSGFFRTGDLVEICGGGQFYRIAGRSKDIINRGGMKISPVELDVALEQHPAVMEAAVCAYSDERLGEKVCACLVPQPDAEQPTLAALQQYLLEQGFAKFKLPERLELLQQLPRNPLGKVQRFALQEQMANTQEHSHE
ncbi:(2,3-dihydroxybenzoyl)adenylate synthase [Halioglobus maricola]|uniref:(2,3-dihydroxybenzoyl)adenylate synthase n=1 Tax=Halioglobus maricola TaxID=2601894 RepID=A0A5P9NNC1_9GAMM|nr:class I adenylate-forming enzyme family protein [Halioglobus maricola]QFU77320.1 (2,3-dihydroxybenzoyl)adenylate synthase [Halioglobus maricola]